MSGGALFSYVGLAVLYAGVATALLGAAGFVIGLCATARTLTTLFVILFFVFLTQHPFPNPATLQCPVPKAHPNLVPLQFAEAWAWQWRRNDTFAGFLRGAPVLSVAMNLLLCCLIGTMLSRYPMRLRTAMMIGVALSLAVELTQLTGIWKLYPCAFRKFDVDDLLLNALGVVLGFIGARRLIAA